MTDRRALVVLVLVHLAIVAVVQPRGEFPLNDDWAYAHSVQWLLEEHRIRLSQWIAMNLVPQTLAGGLVTYLFGFSFETLRHLTQVVAVVAMFVLFKWFRTAGLESGAALIATCAVVAFPAWPSLANTYMTDLYGLALAMAAAIFFLRALSSPSPAVLAWATAFAIAGVLQRQVVLAVSFSFMVAFLFTRRPPNRRNLAIAIIPFVLTLATEMAFHWYLATGPGLPEGQRVAHGRITTMLAKGLTNEDGVAAWQAKNFAQLSAYLAFFSAGFLAWWGLAGASRKVAVGIVAGAAVLFGAALAFEWYPPYRIDQVLDRPGIGPYMLHDRLRGLFPLDRTPGVFWPVMGLVASVALAALVAGALRAVSVAWRSAEPALVFSVVFCIAYLGPFIATDYIDRYMLFVLPFLFVAWTHAWPRPAPGVSARQWVGAVWIAGAIALSAVATRDYYAWNRARWDAIRLAERMGGNADTIDGGFEYNAYRRYERSGNGVAEGKSWWFVKDDEYVVAFSQVPGYRVVETWNVAHLLPRSPSRIFLLQRNP